MRLFIGVELSDEVRAAAAHAAERLRDGLRNAHLLVNARWVAAENLHITLWFIGEVDDERARAITVALASPFPVAPFDLVLEGCGAFPPSGAPRVFWIGVRSGADSMRALYRHLAERLAPLGFQPERRPYSAHLTIARVKDTPRHATVAIGRVLTDTPADAGWCRIDALTVFRSHLSAKGATYEALTRVPLRA